ncbi:MAG: hypothetical protein ACLFUR_03715 [Candidatus Hadarchaeia archaeon]
MGRTIHYWTTKKIDENQIRSIREIFKSLNSKLDFECEKLKIWGKGPLRSVSGGWGFTKIDSEGGKLKVLKSLRIVSGKFPEVSWTVLDEGKLRPKIYQVKEGRIIAHENSNSIW